MPNYQVYYKKDLQQDTQEALDDFENAYVPIMRLWEENLDDVFFTMQGDIWSPNGEARKVIENLELTHTSMSIGDVVEDLDTGEWAEVLPFGWRDIKFNV